MQTGKFQAAVLSLILAGCNARVASWYPLQPGDQWTYQHETFDQQDQNRVDVERWVTEERVLSAVKVPDLDATLVTKRIKVLSDTVTPDFFPENNRAKREPAETQLLVRQKCIYLLDGHDGDSEPCVQRGGECLAPQDQANRIRPEYRDDLLAGKIPGDYCFPMGLGATWGKVQNTSPGNEYVWKVTGLNADPFGPNGGTTFHMSAHAWAGTQIDRWFTQDVGVVQETIEHHGTFEENRRQLLGSTINGRTRKYQLKAARVAPWGPDDCGLPRWQHYSRPDGSSFASEADCLRWASSQQR